MAETVSVDLLAAVAARAKGEKQQRQRAMDNIVELLFERAVLRESLRLLVTVIAKEPGLAPSPALTGAIEGALDTLEGEFNA